MKTILRMALVVLMALPLAAQAQQSNYFTDKNNVAINGYDVVSYFTQYEAQKGSAQHTARHDGVTFHFTSADNQALFVANPEKYLPAYGGYCAFAVAAKGAKVPTNPETFKIYNGKLLLFFNDLYEGKPFNTIVPWNNDEANLAKAADQQWSSLND